MRRVARVLTAGVLLAGLAVLEGCVPASRLVERSAVRLPAFAPAPALQRLIDPRPASPGALAWLGGDVASSVQVGPARWIWIFGDTLLGAVRADCAGGLAYCDRDVDDRLTHGMIPNSVGVMVRRADGTLAPLRTHWQVDAAGLPAPMFAAAEAGEFLWPLALAYVDDVLLIAASRHTRDAGLVSLGDVLIRVHNPAEVPEQWEYDLASVPNTQPDRVDAQVAAGSPATLPAPAATSPPMSLTWATELVLAEGMVHLVGRLGAGADARTVLARFPAAGVGADDWEPRLEYFQRLPDADGGDAGPADAALEWTTAFDADLLYSVPGLPGTSEATIAFDPRFGWYSYRIAWLSHTIELFTAPALAGPWERRGGVYEIPPPEGCAGRIGAADATCAGAPYFAYAAKAHPAWAASDLHVVSYNVNVLSTDLEDALRAAEHARAFYVPRIVAAPVEDE